MSKTLLEALIKLFAIVIKEDNVTKDERNKVRDVLKNQLNEDLVQSYMVFFDEEVEKLSNSPRVKEEMLIDSLCESINQELTKHQMYAILLQLNAVTLADGTISTREEELVEHIRANFKVDPKEFEVLKNFVVAQNREDFIGDNILIIDAQDKDANANYHQLKRKGVDGFISIIYFQDINSAFIKKLGMTEVFLNGIALPNNHIKAFSEGSSIRGKFETVYYTDLLSVYQSAEKLPQLSLEVKNISFTFKNDHIGLRNINFSERSGKLISIMGASGAGKSTLLNVLNGTTKPTKGVVTINNINIHEHPENVEGVIGYVPQDDLLLEDLTVFDNLYFAAKLCFSNKSNEEIEQLVEKTLSSIGLYQIKDLKVGSPLEKVISGGQRKRVNIALELLREPSVLFVDEPTSGLSSRDSENIMDLLKELSLNGKIVFVVIHQPSSHIFKMFDRLLILDTGGYQIYYGVPVESVIHFKEAMKMLDSQEGECVTCGNVNPEQVFDIIETKVLDEYGHVTKVRKVSPEEWASEYSKLPSPPPIEPVKEKPKSTLHIPNKLAQMGIFIKRDVLSKLANRQYILINLLEAPVLAVVLAFLVKYSGHEYIFFKNTNIPSYIFMSIIVAMFMGLTVSAEEIIKDKKILQREAFLNLSKGSYISSKLILMFSISAVQTLLFVLIGNTILEINGMYLIFWAILFSTSCFANLLGLNISSAMNSVVTVYILIPFLLIPQILLSGVVVKFDQLHKVVRNEVNVPIIGDLMVSRWALEASLVAQFTDNEFEKKFYTYDKIISETRYNSVYYIPKLETNLLEGFSMMKSENEEEKEKATQKLNLVRSEIEKQLSILGKEKLPNYTKINTVELDQKMLSSTLDFIKVLKTYNLRKQSKAMAAKDKVIVELQKEGVFNELKQNYSNETIEKTVTNSLSQQRIIEKGGSLYQVIDPVFLETPPTNIFDYRTPLYTAKKYLMGLTFPTPVFNIIAIWAMSIFLIIALYNDWLKRILKLF
ncbi:MAG: ATP-binding cassette domain-containing protein [Cyclobacteriaceae bacterium]|nr:ATP-binding cassette domain-containing protein [Cyclobacteriaceae bacterium]